MVIDKVELRALSIPLLTPFETSFARETHKDCILVTVYAEGQRGWGEAPVTVPPLYSSETIETAWHILRDFLIPLCRTAPEPDDFASQAKKFKGHHMAKAGLEAALWDLRCEREQSSLAKLLGGTREEVEVGVSVGLEATTDAVFEKVTKYYDSGYRRIKLKIKPGQDRALLQRFRDTYPDLPLQADANCAYGIEDTPHLISLDDFDLLLLEQPFASDALTAHIELQRRMKTPLCLDESVTSPSLAQQCLDLKACGNINIKQARVGGILAAKAIHDLCLSRGVEVWCGGMLETGVGRFHNLALASLPGFTLPGDISESGRYFEQDILSRPITLNPEGRIEVPKFGGGVDRMVDWPSLEKFTVRLETV